MKTLLLSLALMAQLNGTAQNEQATTGPLPTKAQVEWQRMETNAFVHFGTNTFTGKEWGFGDAAPETFNPTRLDADQWMTVLKQAGIKGLILTCKHHDGFCLWPTKYTDYNISKSPFRNGRGDLVREVSDACRRHGIKFGVYLSPWDRHQASYGTPEYVEYYYHQLEELLTNYGEIFEVWLDGANGGDGYYGGAREKRKIDRRSYYHFERVAAMVKRLQPNAIIFSDAGPGCRWVGNEKGFAGTTNWSMLRSRDVFVGYDKPKELTVGHEDGDQWSAAECDVSIRPGWFYHPEEDNQVKTARQLAELYYQSVGRNALLLLNFPVNREGRIAPQDSAQAVGFRQIIDCELGNDLLREAKKVWKTDRQLVVSLHEPTEMNRLVLQEDISQGQRVKLFRVEYYVKGKWLALPVDEETTTIGMKRILRFSNITAKKLRINIEASRAKPLICNVEAHCAPPAE